MHVLVTGGAGFIGSHIVDALLGAHHRVRVLDNLSTGHLRNLEGCLDRIELLEGDIRQQQDCDRAMRGITHVLHEAALVSVPLSIQDPALNHGINVQGTQNLLRAARAEGVKRFGMASSAAVYGNRPGLPKREGDPREYLSPYAEAKGLGEDFLRAAEGMETFALRYFNVYGPRQDPSSMYAGVISKFQDVLSQGGTPLIFGDGGQTRDFVYVKDVARANLAALSAPLSAPGEVFNIGTGTAVSLLDLLHTLARTLGVTTSPEFRPEREGDVRHSLADVCRARDGLGFQARFSLAEGLQDWLETKS